MTPTETIHDRHAAALLEVLARCCDTGHYFNITPEAVDAKARLLLLDTVGCMLAARTAPEVARFESEFSSLESGPFRFPGGQRLSTLGATAVAAMAATWDEACEGLAIAHGRPGVPVIAALLPKALTRDATLGQLLAAIITGYEVGARAGAWLRIQPGMHVDGNWPAIGVAAGVARLLELSPAMATAAVNAAACQLGTSLYLPVSVGANVRNSYLAHSAWLGLLSALSAAAGVSAPQGALEHYAGRFAAPADGEPVATDRFLLLDGYIKPHAAVRHAHYGAEAARQLRDELEGRTQGITAVTLATYAEAVTYCGNRDAQTPIQAQFSLSFGAAAGLRHSGIDAGVYRKERFFDPELRRLEKLVQVEIDPVLGDAGRRGAKLTLVADGETWSTRVTSIKGDPSEPMSAEEVAAKFMRYAGGNVPAEKAYAFSSALVSCDAATPLRDVWDLLF